jgi:catecholate siderophore receptor
MTKTFLSPLAALVGLAMLTGTAFAQSIRFDIPAGPLSTAIARFEAAAHVHITAPSEAPISTLTSPGVSGVYEVEQALRLLLDGTKLGFRSTAPGTYALEVRVAPEAVEVTATAIPYRTEASETATKTLTPLRDIPQTLHIVPRELLVDQNARSVADAVKTVPGVSVAQGEGNRDQVVLRGISSSSDFFVNGVRDDQERFRDLYNVQSLEVVQGPAAVLFGRGGAGGIVNLVTRKPMRGAPSEVSVEFGSEDRKRGVAQISAPLGTRAALLLNVMGEDSGGFRDGYFLRRYGINPTVRFDAGRATTLTVGFEHLSDRRLADRGIPSQAGRPVAVAASQFFGSPTQNHAHSSVDSVSTTFEHRFSSGFRLQNSLLAGKYDRSYQNVYPGSAVSAGGTFTLSAYDHVTNRTNAFNQTDLTYNLKIGRTIHTLLFGTEVGHQFQDDLRHTASNIPDVALSNSIRDANFQTAPLAFDRNAAANIVAGYVQDQIAWSRRWKSVVGVRTDRFAVAVDNHLPGIADLSRTDVAASPRAGLIYQPNGVASFYTSYAYTFLPSGQTLGLATNTVDLKPEDARNYEAGARLELLDKRLNLSAAVFRLDRNHVRNTDPTDPTRLVQTGQQRTEGVSVSAAGSLLPQWKLYGGYANLNARLTEDTSSGPAGRKVGLVPRNQLTLWSTYDLWKQWGAGGGVIAQSSTSTSFTNQVELPAFARVDAVVYRRIRGYRIALNVENLLNARYYPTANSDNNISPGAPRNVQLSLTATF